MSKFDFVIIHAWVLSKLFKGHNVRSQYWYTDRILSWFHLASISVQPSSLSNIVNSMYVHVHDVAYTCSLVESSTYLMCISEVHQSSRITYIYAHCPWTYIYVSDLAAFQIHLHIEFLQLYIDYHLMLKVFDVFNNNIFERSQSEKIINLISILYSTYSYQDFENWVLTLQLMNSTNH